MAYTGNPSTDTSDAVRLLIGDTSTSTGGEIFQDGEIDYFVAHYPNTHLAAAGALESIMGSTRADALGNLAGKKVGDLSLSYAGGGQGGYLTMRAKIRRLRMEGVRKVKPYAGGISRSDKEAAQTDVDWAEPAFRRGQFEHPGLGSTSTESYRW